MSPLGTAGLSWRRLTTGFWATTAGSPFGRSPNAFSDPGLAFFGPPRLLALQGCRQVVRVRREHLQILRPVVGRVVVFVVNNLVRQEAAAEHLFRDKAVFTHPALVVRFGVAWHPHEDVSAPVQGPPAFPVWMPGPRLWPAPPHAKPKAAARLVHRQARPAQAGGDLLDRLPLFLVPAAHVLHRPVNPTPVPAAHAEAAQDLTHPGLLAPQTLGDLTLKEPFVFVHPADDLMV